MSNEDMRPQSSEMRPQSSKRNLPQGASSRNLSDETPRITVSECIAQKYNGESQLGKYHGKGKYTSEQGTYVGEFFNGTFHGQGTMHVKAGRFEGFWEYGVMVDGIYIFDDELKYKRTGEKYWDYCSAHDYRFQKEILENIPKDGQLKYKHPRDQNEKKLPVNCYDFIEGYYDPKRNMICSHDTDSDIRTPNEKEIEWIMKNCRIGTH